ncbi:DUF6955 family protein [Desulfobacterium sp. N47]|uniref:Uncharacterized protein n=1 Tax=uncultured Desulfobacterium sp. TaxID=201089 RepID=E1YM26_9BACT|nr:hypothetical protein N47_E46710 [uncultured Desulfobacterium sp.]
MADYNINIFLDDEKLKKVEAAELAGQVKEIDGKKAIQVPFTDKEHKKLIKGFPDLTFDASNGCIIPENAENTLFGIVIDMKTVDVIKFAIMKIYNPLAGKSIRSARY